MPVPARTLLAQGGMALGYAGRELSRSNPYAELDAACNALEAAITDVPPHSSKTSPYYLFGSDDVPNVSLTRYATHLASRINHGEVGVMLGLVLVLRSWKRLGLAPSRDTIHRLLLAGTVVAMKAHFDDFYVNKYMSKIGGLETPSEMGSLEVNFFVNIAQCSANVHADELRTFLFENLIPWGYQLEAKTLQPTAIARMCRYMIDPRTGGSVPPIASLLTSPRTPAHRDAAVYSALPQFASFEGSPAPGASLEAPVFVDGRNDASPLVSNVMVGTAGGGVTARSGQSASPSYAAAGEPEVSTGEFPSSTHGHAGLLEPSAVGSGACFARAHRSFHNAGSSVSSGVGM
jgi:hypothetical protein